MSGRPIILDLNALTYTDSKSINLVLCDQERATKVGLRLIIANPAQILRRLRAL